MIEEFEEVELFEGMLTEGIRLRLIIEDVILEERCWYKNELTVQHVAEEALDRGNVQGLISPGELLKACDYYLKLYIAPEKL
jgi:hypothetical protein